MLKVKIFTLYPELFPGPFNYSLFKRAREKNIWSIETINIRDYAKDKNRTVDDSPFGGGSGMLMRADVLAKAMDENINLNEIQKNIYLSPKGKKFDNKFA